MDRVGVSPPEGAGPVVYQKSSATAADGTICVSRPCETGISPDFDQGGSEECGPVQAFTMERGVGALYYSSRFVRFEHPLALDRRRPSCDNPTYLFSYRLEPLLDSP